MSEASRRENLNSMIQAEFDWISGDQNRNIGYTDV
jgi:hypothetical protein